MAEIIDDLKRICVGLHARDRALLRQGADQQKRQLDRFVNKIVPKA